MTRFERVDLAIKAFTVLIAFFGVGLYFHEESVRRSSLADQSSLSYIKSFREADILSARIGLADFWRDQAEFSNFISDNNVTRREYLMFAEFALGEYHSSHDVNRSLMTLIAFLDEAYHCRKSGVCNQFILDDFFCQYIEGYEKAYGPFYEVISSRIASRQIGVNLSQYSLQCANSKSKGL